MRRRACTPAGDNVGFDPNLPLYALDLRLHAGTSLILLTEKEAELKTPNLWLSRVLQNCHAGSGKHLASGEVLQASATCTIEQRLHGTTDESLHVSIAMPADRV